MHYFLENKNYVIIHSGVGYNIFINRGQENGKKWTTHISFT